MSEPDVYEYGFLVEDPKPNVTDQMFTTANPARPEQVVGRYVPTDPAIVDKIVSRARLAQSEWRAIPPVERSRVIARFLNAVEQRTEAIATAVTREQGKPLAEARGEIGKSLREAQFVVGEAARQAGVIMASQRPGIRNMILQRPRGVIAAITPWNFPVLTPMRKIAPALAFGNAVIIKPSEFTPAAVALIEQASQGILPKGLLQVVYGHRELGTAIVEHPGLDGVTFTGSVATGKSIYRAAASNLTEVSLELGGKNAVVINDTNDLDGCLDQVVGAANQCAGQRCTAISRVIVHESLKESVLDGLKRRAEAERLGAGDEAEITMGPLIHKAQRDQVADYVRQAHADGARVVAGGDIADVENAPSGFFFQPTVITDVTRAMSVAREEIFGPVLVVLTYRTTEEAFELLNDTKFGLTSALFSNDNQLVQRFLDWAETGMLHVNHGTIPDDHMPFGGIHDSGVGAYSVGASAARFYTTEHSAYVKYQ